MSEEPLYAFLLLGGQKLLIKYVWDMDSSTKETANKHMLSIRQRTFILQMRSFKCIYGGCQTMPLGHALY